MPKKAQLKIVNRPDQLSALANEKFDKCTNDLLSRLDEKEFSSFDSLYIILLFNYPIEKLLKGKPEPLGGKASLWKINYPTGENPKKQAELIMIRFHLDTLNSLFDEETIVENFNIILLYNKPYESLNLENKIPKTFQEEGLSVFTPIVPKYRLDRVVLNDNLIAEIKSTLKILEKVDLIYNIWGFNEIEPAPKAIMNFYGPPGTGKTMAAHAIADFLGLKILALNYADIESKYVGEAPKNLVKAFETAQKLNTILFFDEADSFLGKRISSVTSNADQSVNSLRSQMLMLLDNFSGVIIFATNLIENYDRAFESRIFKHLFFEIPSAINRKKIIPLTLPPRVPYENDCPLTEHELDQLVELSDGFSGRYIKNAILYGLTNAIADDRTFVRFTDFQNSFKETKKIIEELNKASSNQNKIKLSPETKQVLETKIKESLIETNQVSTD